MTTRTPHAVDDPTVKALARFLEAAPLADGRTTSGLASPTTDLLAQAIVNWTVGLVWQDGHWIERSTWESTPDLGDIEIEPIADGQVVRMTQRSTGISALGETHDEAWAELRRKVQNNG